MIATYSHNVQDLDLLVPIPNPPKILCLAFNYYDHARDAGLTPLTSRSFS